MANPWDNDPIVRSRKTDPRIDEREQAETRYRNLTGDANPLAQPVILPGEEGYAGDGQYLPEADVVVRGNVPWANDLQVTPGSEAIRANANPVGAFAQGAAEQIPFLDEAAARAVSLITGEPYDYVRETQRMGNQIDREEQPLARNAGGVTGFAAGIAAPGAAYVRGAQGAAQIGRAATLGAGYGGAYGAGAAEDGYASRLAGLGTGAAVGGVTGGALQAAAPLVSRATGAVSRGVSSIVNPTGRLRARGNITPEVSAASRFSEFVTPEALTERQRLIDLGLQPSAMDVLGGTAERLVRTAAGPAGPGAEMAVTRSRALTQNLKSDVMSDTRALTGDPRSASQVREGLLETRSNLADEMYPEAYATPVAVTDDLMSALGDDPGRAALRRARSAAVSRRNAQQVAEIDALLSGSRPLDMSSEAVAQRARDQGFNPDRTYYHGSPENISSFRTDMGGGNYGEGLYTTRMAEKAAGYAGPEGAVYPLVIRPERTLDITTPEGRAIFDARKRGVSTREALGSEYDVIKAPGETIVLNENAVRSRFDQFAPEGYTPPPSEVSAGTLDRTRIAMAGRARRMQQNPDTNDIASGLFVRAGQIDDVLEDVPELAPARETYRNLSGAVDALDEAGQVFSLPPQDFEGIVRSLTPEQREAAIIGVRQEIMDTLGGQKAAGTGSLDRISQAPYVRQNLALLLGEDEAARYLAQIDARVQQTQRAARVSPNTNSQAFGRGMDEETLSVAERLGAVTDAATGVMGNLGGIARTIDRVRDSVRGATMSPQERAAIVQMGFGSADELERIVMLADQARANRRPPPREVRAWITSATSRLGANNPAVRELQQLLLPAVSPAQETETQP